MCPPDGEAQHKMGMMMATVREATYTLLRALGMTTVFGNPGSTELPFLQDFPDDFTYVLGLQESVVLGMADGYAQGRGRAALVNLHTTAGLGNAMGAIVTAYHNRSPLVITAGQQDRRQLALEPLLSGDLVELAKPYVKWSHQPGRPQDVPAAIARAYHLAMQEPQGPVFVSVPMDDWAAEAAPLDPAAHEVVYRTAPDPVALARVARALQEARQPAIVAGAEVDRARAWNAVVALAERARAAVWADPIGSRAGFPQDHALFRGHLAPAQALLAGQLAEYDVVLVLGAPAFLYYPYVPGPTVQPGTQLFHITTDPDEAARAAAGVSLVGDVGLAARRLIDLLGEAARPAPAARAAPAAPEATTPLSVAYVMQSLAAALPVGAVLVDESISSKSTLNRYIRVNQPGGYYTSASGGLGFAMPAAVGLQLAVPERRVVCVIGDGSSMYAIQALWSAARYNAAVAYVVVNNGQYAILKGFGALLGASGVPGLDVPGIDLVSVARGLGVAGETVARPEALAGALERALSGERPYLVNVIVDPTVPSLLG